MHALAKLTRLEAKVLFLRDPVLLVVALAVPIGILRRLSTTPSARRCCSAPRWRSTRPSAT